MIVQFDSFKDSNCKIKTKSNSSLKLNQNNKKYFLENTNSFIKIDKKELIYFEYIKLIDNKYNDAITITDNGITYKINLYNQLLINNNLYYQLNFAYLPLSESFLIDNTEQKSYDINNIICDIFYSYSHPWPSLLLSLDNLQLNFNKWIGNNLFAISNCDNSTACIYTTTKNSYLTILLKINGLKKSICFTSLSKQNILQNEIQQINCSEIKPIFSHVKCEYLPSVIPNNSIININNLDKNYKIVSSYDII